MHCKKCNKILVQLGIDELRILLTDIQPVVLQQVFHNRQNVLEFVKVCVMGSVQHQKLADSVETKAKYIALRAWRIHTPTYKQNEQEIANCRRARARICSRGTE